MDKELFRFRPTGNFEKDYENYLKLEANGTNYDCTIYHDYPSGGGIVTRCSCNRNAGSDRYALRTACKDPIRRGDLLFFSNAWFLLTEDVAKQVNCYVTAPSKCNAIIEIKRDISEITDENGYLLTPATTQAIVLQQPCIVQDNIGNIAAYGMGTWTIENPVLYFQLNNETAQIKADDYFLRGGEKYRVLALGWQETLSDGTTGVLTVTARKEAGSSAKEI